MKKSVIFTLILSCLSIGLFANANGEKVDKDGFKRSETVYVTGGMWMATDRFNPYNSSSVPGIRGLVNESLFMWSPFTNTLEPWLAQSFEWVEDGKTMEIVMTEGAYFSNGEPVTIEDIAFSFSYGSYTNPYGVDEVEIIDEKTVRVRWENPMYHSLVYQLYTWPVCPKSFWSDVPASASSEISILVEESLGSGPYKLESFQQDRVIFVRDDNWWGKETLGMEFPAKRVVYFKNLSNNVVMGLLDKGELDMANNFIPGLSQAKKKNENIVTWLNDEPYHASDNIAYLFPNHTREPYSDVEFRRALAYAIDPAEIADIAFEDMVSPRYNALGLHKTPAWAQYVNEDIIDEYGFEYDASEAEAILDDAGYTDQDGDGYRDFPDGGYLEVTIAVPISYSDWKDATQVMADQLERIGIKCTPKYPDEGRWQTDLVNGDFDMVINNWNSYQSPSPFSLYQWLGSTLVAVGEPDWTGNYGRYDNPEFTDLINELGFTPYDDIEASNELIREIQTIMLTEFPQIPLWVNGLWFAANDSVWTNWPNTENSSNRNYPAVNYAMFQIGGLKMLANLKLNTAE